MKIYTMLISLLFLLESSRAQDIIQLTNPSFEGAPGAGIDIVGWKNLGSLDQTPPDIQPGYFGVNLKPQHMRNYLGLVVREVNSWEGVGQQLDGILSKDSTYSFSLWLSRSNAYQSPLMTKNEVVSFNSPTILKIWGYNTETQQEELLGESQAIGHSEWIRYEFLLKPTKGSYDELDLMAYYAAGFEQTNGNLLIDNCSDIVKIRK